MFERVLIAEDHENTSISLKRALEEMGVKEATYVSYCDYALAWIKKGLKAAQPYDLFITDLSFEEDHNVQEIKDGIALIKAVKNIQPDLKILVFSAEGRPEVISSLRRDLEIDAYVRKARQDVKELRTALQAIVERKSYFPLQMRSSARDNNSFNFTNYDITVIRLLAGGRKQKEIPTYLEENNIRPAGLSSMEKRLNVIKDNFNFTSNEQLIAYCKDFNII